MYPRTPSLLLFGLPVNSSLRIITVLDTSACPPGPLSALLPAVCPGGWHVRTASMSSLFGNVNGNYWWEMGKRRRVISSCLFLPFLVAMGWLFPLRDHSSSYTALPIQLPPMPPLALSALGEVMASSSSSPRILPYLSLVFFHLSHIFMNNLLNFPQVFNLSLSSVFCENSEW